MDNIVEAVHRANAEGFAAEFNHSVQFSLGSTDPKVRQQKDLVVVKSDT